MVYCQREGFDEEIEQAEYPHPYILIWLETLRHADSMSGAPAYPDPVRGYLEQDADLMLACQVCDAYREEQSKEEEQKKQVTTRAKEQGW